MNGVAGIEVKNSICTENVSCGNSHFLFRSILQRDGFAAFHSFVGGSREGCRLDQLDGSFVEGGPGDGEFFTSFFEGDGALAVSRDVDGNFSSLGILDLDGSRMSGGDER